MHLIFSLLLPLSHLWVCYSFCLKYFSSPSHCHPGYLLTVQDCWGGWSHNPWVLSCLGMLCRNSTVLIFPQLEWGHGFRAVSVWLTITTCVRRAVSKCLLSECWDSDLALWGIPCLTQDWLPFLREICLVIGDIPDRQGSQQDPFQGAITFCRWDVGWSSC